MRVILNSCAALLSQFSMRCSTTGAPKRAFSLAALLLTAGCFETSHRTAHLEVGHGAIIAGTRDEQHGAVMALLRIDRQGMIEDIQGACSGTVIALREHSAFLLTAAHCAVELAASGDAQIPPRPVDPSELAIFSGPDWLQSYDARRAYPVTDVVVHPQYDGAIDSAFDVAVLRYVGAISDLPVIPIQASDSNELAIGSVVTLVGFGSDDSGQLNTIRLSADKMIARLSADQIGFDQNDGGGTCDGDSGGPVIIQTSDGERVAAVTSFGDRSCTRHGVAVRISSTTRSFIQEVVDSVRTSEACGECRLIATAPDNRCFQQQSECASTASPCALYLECIAECEHQECYAHCELTNPEGAQASRELQICTCQDACPDLCATSLPCHLPSIGNALGSVAGAATPEDGRTPDVGCSLVDSNIGLGDFLATSLLLASSFRRKRRPWLTQETFGSGS